MRVAMPAVAGPAVCGGDSAAEVTVALLGVVARRRLGRDDRRAAAAAGERRMLLVRNRPGRCKPFGPLPFGQGHGGVFCSRAVFGIFAQMDVLV